MLRQLVQVEVSGSLVFVERNVAFDRRLLLKMRHSIKLISEP